MTRLLFKALIALYWLTVAPPQQTGVSTVEGVVVAYGSNQRMGNTRVQLIGIDQGKVLTLTTQTTSDGRFSFHDVPVGVGQRLIAGGDHGVVQVVDGNVEPLGLVLNLRAGQNISVQLELAATGILHGHVLDEKGKAVRNAVVSVHKLKYQSGHKLFAGLPDVRRGSTAEVRTNDRGEYRVTDLPPGQYYIAAQTGESVVFTDGILKTLCNPQARPNANLGPMGVLFAKGGLLPTYFPTTIYPSNAELVNVAPSSETGPLNITLRTVLTRRAQGEVINGLTGARVRSGNITIVPRRNIFDPSFSCSISINKGMFDFLALPPGSYSLFASTEDNLTGSLDIQIGEADRRNLTVMVAQPIILKTSLILKPGVASDSTQLRVRLDPDPPFGAIAPVVGSIATDGVAVLGPIAPWNYEVTVAPLLGADYISSARLNGINVLSERLQIRQQPLSNLEITLEPGGGTVQGRVTGGVPALRDGFIVTLAPEQQQVGSGFYRVTHSDSTGQFRFSGIPPGNYKAFAWLSLEPGLERDADFIRLYEREGTAVTIDAVRTRMLEVPLITRLK